MHIKNSGRPLDNKLLAALPRDPSQNRLSTATIRFGAMSGTGPTIRLVRSYIEVLPARTALSARLPPTPLRETARPTGQDIAVHIKNLGRPLDNKLLAALPRDHSICWLPI